MTIRAATPDDAEAIAAIYAPIVADTAISFELEPPSGDEMRSRIAATLQRLPWLARGARHPVCQCGPCAPSAGRPGP